MADSAEGSRFEDPGVQIVENLFVHEPGESSIQSSSGRVITDLISELEKADERYSVIVQAYLKDQNNTLDDTILSGSIEYS